MLTETLMLAMISGLIFGSVAIAGLATYPPLLTNVKLYVDRRATDARIQLDDIFVNLSQYRLKLLYVAAPLVLGLLFWVLSGGRWLVAAAGFSLGLVVPKLTVPFVKAKRNKTFHAQLVDGLLLLSSCLRAGLSMLQSFTVIAEEMPTPINQEFGLILKETRMGINLDEAMTHFKQRMPSDDTSLFVTAVLVARESGGDVTAIFARLVETLRERKKIREKIKTLTFMARMQAVVMALLPIAFSYTVAKIDPNHFTFFLHDPVGKLLLAGIVVLQLFGAYLFIRFSRSPL
ncbi:MAG: type II secretion system F family protein [Candidatus Omnitrophota bacterium]|nr:type II secretion system F family protein [Candidatus Omnitrophota bacterium]